MYYRLCRGGFIHYIFLFHLEIGNDSQKEWWIGSMRESQVSLLISRPMQLTTASLVNNRCKSGLFDLQLLNKRYPDTRCQVILSTHAVMREWGKGLYFNWRSLMVIKMVDVIWKPLLDIKSCHCIGSHASEIIWVTKQRRIFVATTWLIQLLFVVLIRASINWYEDFLTQQPFESNRTVGCLKKSHHLYNSVCG